MTASGTKDARENAKFDRHFWLILLVGAAVLFPRAIFIARAHNDYTDDQYHLVRGERFLAGLMTKYPVVLNDPPLGEALIALPLRWSGDRNYNGNVIYDQKAARPETLLLRVALWKAFLVLPMIAIAFCWMRALYGTLGGWLAGLLLLFEPSFAAHINVAALDVIGVEGIFIACFLAWRYVGRPTWRRAIALAFSCAAALLIKNTAIILPLVVGAIIFAWAIKRRKFERRRWFQLLAILLLVPLMLWALLGFEISVPSVIGKLSNQKTHPTIARLLEHRLPAGMYFGAVANAFDHGSRGHDAFLFGKTRGNGWLYYFPAVALFKVPIGYGLLGVLAIGSLWLVRPRFDELSLLIPAIAWTVFLCVSRINIGWRHFLPAYAFLLMLTCRVALVQFRWTPLAALACLAIGAVHGLLWLPNDLSYLNFPRKRAYLSISDSNLDWGQGIKQARDWIQSHRALTRGRSQIFVRIFCRDESPGLNLYLSSLHNVHVLRAGDPPPRSGTLIVSVVWLTGLYGDSTFMPLKKEKPIAQIGGGAMRVYDLGRIKTWKRYAMKRPTTSLSTTPTTQNDAGRP